MGQANAESAIQASLNSARPSLVLTCGFAGGLNPGLRRGDVVYDTDPGLEIPAAFAETGARRARFRLAKSVLATSADKITMHQLTGADAVEMESVVIRAICRKANIPSATVRVILDEAGENLPVDFNRFMDSHQRLSYVRLILAILRRPALIAALRNLQQQSAMAAERLDQAIGTLLKA
jgi:adenosylhomocysteine nucleosidase